MKCSIVLLVVILLGALSPSVGAQILVSSFFDDAVQMYETNTGEFLGTFTKGQRPVDPQGLAFGPNGNLLVVSRGPGDVLEYDKGTGEFVRTLIDGRLDNPVDMVANSQGQLLIAEKNQISKYDAATGEFIETFASIDGTLIGIEFGPNGNLFVSAPLGDEVIEVDANTGSTSLFASGGFGSPNKIVFGGPENHLFIGEDSAHSIVEVDGDTGEFVRTLISGFDMDHPSALVFHPNGNLLVGTGFGDTIIEVNSVTGEFVRTFASAGIQFATAAIVISERTLSSDLTNNGFVDFEDLTILLANWNQDVTISQGNLINPSTTPVNFEDLTVLLADWTGPGPAGSPEAALGAEAVPEPSTLLLALLATLGLSFCRRRRRRAF